MKQIIVLLFIAFSSFTAIAQKSQIDCNQVLIEKKHKSETLVKLIICGNDTTRQTIETYLKPCYRPRTFKNRRYLMTRHGISRRTESNGDYKVSEFKNGIIISERYYLQNGTEISLKKYEKSHAQIYFSNGVVEYFQNGQIITFIKI